MRTQQILSSLLIFTLTFGAGTTQAAEEKSATTSALESVGSVLGTVNTGIGAIQFSQQQLQGLVNQYGNLQTQQNAGNAAQSQFDQVKQQLSVALAEASQCIEKAKKDTSKYKKADLKPSEIDGMEPTCKTYGRMIDSIKKNVDQIYEVNTKMSCMLTLQNKMNQIADASKKPFGDLTQSATEVWNTRTGIVDTHKGIVERLDKDLNDKDNGYKAKLAKLKELDIKLRNVIGSGATKEGAGINQRLKTLKRSRVTAANSWYLDLMGEVESCFANDSTQQCSLGSAGSPADCVRAYVNQNPSGSAAQRAQAKANSAKLDNAFRLNAGIIRRNDTTLAKIDVTDPNGFLNHVNKRFSEKLAAVSATFTKLAVVGNSVNKNELRNFVQQKYRDCYDTAVKKFQADIAPGSEGGSYKKVMNDVADAESGLNNDIKNLIDETQQTMTAFRTQFNKLYDRDLSQFTSDCTGSENPYASADCLRKLSVTLKGGIEGTKQSTTLEDGSSTTFTPGPTTMNLQTLALDQSGKATLQNQQTQCVGFDECINVLDRYQSHHADQASSQEKQRDSFVEQHNKTVQTSMTGIAAQFTEVSKMMVAGVKGVNEDLAKAGVSANILTKEIKGEALKASEKTKILEMPTDMKAALAGSGGTYTEVGETTEATTGVNARIAELNKKSLAAAKVKASCIISAKEYSAIAEEFGTCDGAEICKGDVASRVMSPLEALIRKGKNLPSQEKETPITDRFENCMEKANGKLLNKKVSSEDMAKINLDHDTKEARRQAYADRIELNEKGAVVEQSVAAQACIKNANAKLNSENGSVRTESMQKTNQTVLNALRSITKACPADEEAAETACKRAKSALGKVEVPDESETKIDAAGTTETSTFKNSVDVNNKVINAK